MDSNIKIGLGALYVITSILMACPAFAEIYKWTDAHGNVHFSDKKSASLKARPLQLKSNININHFNKNALPAYKSKSTEKKSNKVKRNPLPKLSHGQVILYSTDWCTYCKKAKAYFMQQGIAFSEHDIEKSEQANREYQSYGGGGVPLILVGNKKGTRRLSGFSTVRFEAAYK